MFKDNFFVALNGWASPYLRNEAPIVECFRLHLFFTLNLLRQIVALVALAHKENALVDGVLGDACTMCE